jgi:hypothetical protein
MNPLAGINPNLLKQIAEDTPTRFSGFEDGQPAN